MAIQREHPMSTVDIDLGLAVHVRELRRSFQGRPVLDRVELDITPGEFVALLGASGSGKTTLLKILAGIDTPDAGDVWVPERRTVVFQEPRLVNAKRVAWNVRAGLRSRADSRTRAVAALSEVGLAERADAWPATLSGGEAQRVALARALVRDPQLLLLDEPFAALDALTRLRMQQLIGDLCARHRPATLLVTHDVEEAILLADHALVLREGHIAVDLPVDLPQPRVLGGATFDRFRSRLLGELGVEVSP